MLGPRKQCLHVLENKIMKVRRSHTILVLLLSASTPALSAITYYNTDSYRSRNDSPFLLGLQNGTMYLENFEQRNLEKPPYNYLTTPNAQGWNGAVSGAPNRGVQEDFADGSLGYRWDSGGGSLETRQLPNGIHFDFTPDEQGRLPEYVGAALAGRGLLATEPSFNIILVYDRNGREVTEGNWQIPRPNYDLPYQEADLFLNFEGIFVPGGVSRIHFRDFVEVDHLTYGYAIPEPSSAWLVMCTGIWFLHRRRLEAPYPWH
jgi:hypothetical protein